MFRVIPEILIFVIFVHNSFWLVRNITKFLCKGKFEFHTKIPGITINMVFPKIVEFLIVVFFGRGHFRWSVSGSFFEASFARTS